MPIPLSTGIVKLSSHPKRSATSLAEATKPDQTLMMPRATEPETDAMLSGMPTASVNARGSDRVPVNMKFSSPGMGPIVGTSHPYQR